MLLIYNHLHFDKVYLNLYIFIKSCILIFKFSGLRISTEISRKKESKKMQRKEKMLERMGQVCYRLIGCLKFLQFGDNGMECVVYRACLT